MQRILRLKRELQLLSKNPPHGISCWQEDESVGLLKASKFVFLVKNYVYLHMLGFQSFLF